MRNFVLAIIAVVATAFCSLALAANRQPPPVDRDFAYQGEFVTDAHDAEDRDRLGLQVIALGNGQFQATVLPGGLPGAGWNRAERFIALGSLNASGDAVMLRGDRYGVSVTATRARIRDASGRVVSLRRIVRVSPTLGAAPSRCAVVLFRHGRLNDRLLADTALDAEGLLKPGFALAAPVRDFHLHGEFRTPYMPAARGQNRGNSGIYIQRRYEVQILDSFGLTGERNEGGGLYKQRRPEVNMCLPPLAWQTYDIDFTAARWNAYGKKVAHARITVRHNGVVIHDNAAIVGKTGSGQEESPQALPILFQDHNDAVAFRNLWIEFR